MKIIRVNNQVEGGQVVFSLLKDEMAKGAKTLGLALGSTNRLVSMKKLERAILISQI